MADATRRMLPIPMDEDERARERESFTASDIMAEFCDDYDIVVEQTGGGVATMILAPKGDLSATIGIGPGSYDSYDYAESVFHAEDLSVGDFDDIEGALGEVHNEAPTLSLAGLRDLVKAWEGKR
jgi:hypothetical protein